MTTDLHRLPCRRTAVRLQERGTETVLIDPAHGTSHVLNPTARAIWELCDGTTTITELVDAICEVFAVPRDAAFTDVTMVLDQLATADLVGWSSDDL